MARAGAAHGNRRLAPSGRLKPQVGPGSGFGHVNPRGRYGFAHQQSQPNLEDSRRQGLSQPWAQSIAQSSEVKRSQARSQAH